MMLFDERHHYQVCICTFAGPKLETIIMYLYDTITTQFSSDSQQLSEESTWIQSLSA